MSKTPKTRNTYFAKWIAILIIWLVMLPWNETQAQGCECIGCSAEIPISASNLTFTLDVSGSTNNNLGNPNQGVCGIYIDFDHNFVYALDVTLTAPSGQVITLLGPPVNPSIFPTFFTTTWDIGFLPCGQAVAPDLDGGGIPFAAQWFNNQAWAAGSNYAGTYHPYSGCLESLTGTVDGSWTITINNASPNYNGNFNGFSIVFCDDSGLGCDDCEANAGSLFFVPDFQVCFGESTPPVNLDPTYQNSPPSANYSYTYIVSENNVIQEYNDMTDLSTFAAGTYEVCGLSYLTAEAGQIPLPNGLMSTADLNNQITSSGIFCGEITADCFTMTVNPPPSTVFITTEICDDDTYEIGTESYNTTGVFSTTIPAVAGCDTLVQLDLTVHPTYNFSLNEYICQGQTYFLGTTPYTTSGSYTGNFDSQNNCDSIVNVELTVLNPMVSIDATDELNCQQTEVNLDGSASTSGTDITYLWTTDIGTISGDPNNAITEVNAPGKYYLEVTQSGGGLNCIAIDSIIVTQNIAPSIAEAGMEDTITCQITSLILDGVGSSVGNEFSYQWTTTNGSAIQNPTTLSPTIDLAGWYYIEVTNANSNCVAIDSVLIISNSVLPTVSIAGDAQIDCSNTSVQLNATASSQGSEFNYQWTALSGGPIDSGADGLTPTISNAGTYELLITNTSSMCSAFASVQVTVDTLHPVADAGEDVVLNCNFPTNFLDGSDSSLGGQYSYQWTSISGGPITGDPTILNPQVDVAGVYELTVTNNTNTCFVTSQVTVTTDLVNPTAIGGSNQTISCEEPIVELNGMGSSNGTGTSYEWNVVGDGNVFSGANTLTPEINEAGTYQLTVTNDSNGCSAQSLIIEVFEDTQYPIAMAGVDMMIDCNNANASLNGAGSSLGADYIYQWTASNGGNIFSGEMSLSPVVNAGGTYELVVTDTTNGCFADTSIQVTVDTLAPAANAGLDTVINCYNPIIFLEATGSSTGTNFTYQWTTIDGSFVGNNNTFSVEIDSAGIYELEVTNNMTGCVATDVVTVSENFTASNADAGIDEFLDCDITSVTIGGTNTSLGTDYIYQWTASNGGSIFSGGNNPTAVVNTAGTYELLVTNMISGCTNTDETIITTDVDLPIAIAQADGTIDCNNANTTLNGAGSSLGTDYIYQWTASNGGNIFSGEMTLAPVVNAGGTYELVVTDTTNGCFADALVQVTIDTLAPTANAGVDTVINCYNSTIFLEAIGSSTGTNFTYQWMTTDGNFVGATNTFSVEIDSAGIYELEVTNNLTGCIATNVVIVTENFTTSNADAGIDKALDCDITSISIGGTNTSLGTDYIYQWTASNGGNIFSGENNSTAVVNTAGTYELLVTNAISGCTDTDETIVTTNVDLPVAMAGPDGMIDCNNTTATLNGAGSSLGTDYIYQWTASNGGSISSGEMSLLLVVDAAGTYELMVTDTTNGCAITDIAEVTLDTLLPTANAGLDTTLSCLNSILTLEATGSSVGNNFSYEWTTMDGNFVGATNIFSVEIDSAGTYQLMVINNLTGCAAIDSVVVTGNNTTLVADAGEDVVMGCGVNSITLGGVNTTINTGYLYQWTTIIDGNIISGNNEPMAEVNAVGLYKLLVIDLATGCFSLDTTMVTADVNVPTATAGDDVFVDCNNTNATLTLNGIGSSAGAQFLYQWTSSNGGNILSGDTSLMPVVNEGGDYQLMVTNTSNNCIAIDNVMVTIDTLPPTANAGLDTVINCYNPTIILDGIGSSIGNDIIYQWNTLDGNMVGNNTLIAVEIDSAGTYELVVTNNMTGCVSVDSLIVLENFTPSIAEAGDDAELNCNTTMLTLGGMNTSSGPNYIYQWTASNGGAISSNDDLPNAEINAAGTYELLVTNTLSGCTASDETIITANTDVPISNAGMDTMMVCGQTSLILNANNSSTGSQYVYYWTASNGGNVVSGDSTLMPEINAAGTYTLEVTDTVSNCSISSSLMVTVDATLPIADAGDTMYINCTASTLTLDGSASSIGNEFSYLWTTSEGNILSDETTLNPVVDSAGIYFLTVSNTSNSCVAIGSVMVLLDTLAPVVDAGSDTMLTCSFLEVRLGDDAFIGNEYSYQWTTDIGNFQTPNNLDTVVVNAAGTYTLTITNLNNGCMTSDETMITANTDLPISNAGMDTMMVCGQTSLILNANNSSTGSQYVYHWTASNGGNVVSGDSTLMPEINAAGTYTLEVIDTVSNCSITSSLMVTVDATLPIAEAGDTMYINCMASTSTLDGNASSIGNEFSYQWTTPDGNILSDQTTLNPVVDSAGIYFLTVSNTNNSCEAIDSVMVLLDTLPPVADAGLDTMLTCTFLEVRLGDNAFVGNDYSYQWTTDIGNFQTPNNLDTVVVNVAGTYTLTITNLNNGCMASDEVEVTQDADLPIADVGNINLIPCLTGELTLDGTASSMGSGFQYLWTTGNGNFVSDETTLTPTIDSAGIYLLTVTNILNNCSASEGIIVTNESCNITAEAGTAVTIGCASSTVTLDGTGSSVGFDIVYSWTTLDGEIISDETTLMPQVDGAGTYVLIVEDTLLGITAQDSVEVTTSLEFPTVVAAANGFLSCSDTTVFLISNGSSSGNNFVYNWSTIEGNIIAVVGGTNVLVNEAGWYFLEVMNMTNGCTALDSVEVLQDTSLPIADAGVDTTLNCYSEVIVLDGTNSSSGGSLEYLWTTDDGNILLGDTTLTPTVDSIGTYTLTIVDPLNNCSVSSSIEVTEDFASPISAIITPSVLNCIDTVIILDGSFSSIGNEFNYEWQTSSTGNILSGENTPQSSINATGNYDLIVMDISNGCRDTASVQVMIDTIAPTANAGLDMQLDCGNASILLDGTASTSDNVQYQWSTFNGMMVSGQQTPTLEVSTGGVYTLTIQSDLNGCTATDEVLITQTNCTPIVAVALPDTITCTQTQVTLDGSASSDWATIIYNWSTSNGTIIGVTNVPIITVTSAGDYQLMLTDQLTGLTTSTTVTVFDNNENPIANAGLSDTLTCLTTSIILNGTASSIGNNFTYEWMTSNGNILNDITILTPTVDAPGTYQLLVTNSANNCTSIADVVIEIDTIAPIANAGADMVLTCDNPTLNLDGTASSIGNEFSYAWGTVFGNILLGNETTQPQVDDDGNYALAVTNTRNGCIATDVVFVDIDTLSPTINVVPPMELNCTVTSFNLDGSNSSIGNNFTYEWTTSNGNIISGASDLIPEIDEPGDYLFFIENNNNGCTSEEIVTVAQDTIHPIAAAGTSLELNCEDTILSLDGTASSLGSEFEYTWTTGLGNILDGANTPTPTIDESGTYNLLVTNSNNTCTATDMVVVTQDVEVPTAVIEPANALNCVVPSFMLNANNSSTGTEFNYSWNTIEGNITAGETGTTPTINEGGIYNLVVTNNQNGCTASTSITIQQDTLVPIANAGLPLTLTCIDTVFILNGNNSSLGNEFVYTWTSSNGNIVNGDNSLTPLINEPGMYEIEVLNTVNQCSATDEIQINQDTISPTPMIDAIGGLIITCAVNSIVLDGTGSLPFGEVSFEWSTSNGNIMSGQNSSNPEVDSEGNYFVVLTNDNNGCTETANITITDDFEEPEIAVSTPDLLTCADTVITLSGIGSSVGNEFAYQWISSNGNIISGQNEIQSNVNEPGLYTFIVTDNNNGCSIDTMVTVLQNIDVPMADAGVSYEFDCINPNLQLAATASQGMEFNYNWSTTNGNIIFGQNTLTPIVNMNGSYTLTVTNTFNGCINTSVATVTEDMDIPQNADFEITPPACYGEYNASINVATVFGGEPPYQFSFNNSGSFDDFSEFLYLGAGAYAVAVRDADGCQWDTVLTIEDPDPVVVELGDDLFIELGDDIELEAQTNIPFSELSEVVWTTLDSIPCTDCLVQNLSPLETTGYAVTLTSENGCITDDEVLVYVENKKRIFIPNAFSPDGDGNNDVFMIYGGSGVEEVEEFMIFNRWGELVFEQNNFQPNDALFGWDGFFQGKKLNPAVFIYFAKIKYINGESEIIKGDLFLK